MSPGDLALADCVNRDVRKQVRGVSLLASVAVAPLGKMIILVLVFVAVLGRFLAEAGPRTSLNGPGSKNGVERTFK